MKLKSTLFLLLIYCAVLSKAQTTKPSIQVLSKVTKEGVWLRWAPSKFEVWQLGNRYGYIIERFTIKPDGSIDINAVVKLNTEVIKPLTPGQFQKLDESQKNIGAVGELIYTSEEPENEKEENSPARLLQKEEDQNNRFGMALLICDFSYKTAEAAGLFYNDVTAVKAVRYIYKIKLAAELENGRAFEPGVIVVDVNETPPLKPFNDLRADFKNKTVTLSWPTFTHKGVYGAYIIEKSSDGKTFNSVNDLPYVSMSESTTAEEAHYVDSLATNGTTFSYRVKGITPFGEQGPPSNVVSGAGKDDMTGIIAINKVILNDKKIATLTWNFPVAHEAKISGFQISKSSKADGRYTNLAKKTLPKKVRAFELGELASSSYFQIKAIGKEGEEISVSFPFFYHVEDNTPPAAPTNLAGKISEKGIVSLSWPVNKEMDIMGYRIFSSHNVKNEFVEATTRILTTTQFSDSVDLKLLNKAIFYKVVAVDQNYNTSDYSKSLSLSIPDKVAPVAPVFSKAKITGNQVDLEWIPSTSSDVMEYTLTRITKGDTTKGVIKNWKRENSETSYTDTKIELGKTYQYQLSAYDSTKNYSIALSKVLEFETGLRKSVNDFNATINRDNKTILLKWSYNASVRKCLIYRTENGQSYSLYQSLQGSVQEFLDTLITINNTYQYKIQLMLDNGVKTELSKELKVLF